MVIGSWNLLWCIVIYISKATCAPTLEVNMDLRRPIWSIGHMVNSVEQVDYFLDGGANGLELDITYSREGIAQYTYHGVPCDCFRNCLYSEDIVTYLEYVRKVTTPGAKEYRPQLILLIMDMKIQSLTPYNRVQAGEDIATKLLNHYWKTESPEANVANASILISVPSIAHMDFINSFRNKLKKENFPLYSTKIGFEFSGNEDLDSIRNALDRENFEDHVWQGDGITNCIFRGRDRLQEALRRRDLPGTKYMDKVYYWTVDEMYTMKATLNMGADGMITNWPGRLKMVLNDRAFSDRFRLATLEDNPWEKYTSRIANFTSPPQQGRDNDILEEFEDEEEELLYSIYLR